MPRSSIRIKFFGFAAAPFVVIRFPARFLLMRVRKTARITGHRAAQIDIDEQHDQEQDAECNAQIKDETLAHVTSCAYSVDI